MSVSEAHSTYQGLDLDGLERLISVEILVASFRLMGTGLTDSVEAIIRLLVEKTVLKLAFAVSEPADVALCDAKKVNTR
jgi:hypothetical protein